MTAEKKKRARPAYFFLRPGDTVGSIEQMETLMAWLFDRPGPLANMLRWVFTRDKSKHWKVTISEDKESRSNKQNSIQWLWHTEFAMANGYSKEQAYGMFKYKHCLPIMLANPDAEWDHLRRVWGLVRNDPEAVAGLVKILHTGDLSTKEMAQALTEYDQVNAARGLVFTDPADLRRDAMMVK